MGQLRELWESIPWVLRVVTGLFIIGFVMAAGSSGGPQTQLLGWMVPIMFGLLLLQPLWAYKASFRNLVDRYKPRVA